MPAKSSGKPRLSWPKGSISHLRCWPQPSRCLPATDNNCEAHIVRRSSSLWLLPSPLIVEAEADVINVLPSPWHGGFGISHKAFEHERERMVRRTQIVPSHSCA